MADPNSNAPTLTPLTPTNAPALYARFQELQAKAGISGFRVVFTNDDPKTYTSDEEYEAHADFRKKTIFIGTKLAAGANLDTIMAHELAHVWRHLNLDAPSVITAPLGTNLTQYRELEADTLGVMLTGDLNGAIRELKRTTHVLTDVGYTDGDRNHPTAAVRIESMLRNRTARSPF